MYTYKYHKNKQTNKQTKQQQRQQKTIKFYTEVCGKRRNNIVVLSVPESPRQNKHAEYGLEHNMPVQEKTMIHSR